MPTPTAIDIANAYRAKLAAQEADSVARMGRIYARIYTRLIDDMGELSDEIYNLTEMGASVKREDILKLGRMNRLLSQVETEAAKFGTVVSGEVESTRALASELGADAAIDMIEASLPPLSPEIKKQVMASLTRLPSDAIEAAAGILDPDSPLYAKLQTEYGKAVADQVSQHIVDGIAVGMNPRTIATALQRNLQSSLGTGFNWVMTTVRTAQIKAYHTANHANYLANSAIVPEWVWVSALDSRTCMSCIAKHGTAHPVTEVMADHHNGRCAPVPKTISYKALGINLPDPVDDFPSGEDWFEAQSVTTQKEMLGPGKFAAWEAGKFRFSDLSRSYNDPIYGELWREATLGELTPTVLVHTPQLAAGSIH